MSGARTQRLLRDDPASVAALHARMRDGSLTRERVELAAYCGHEAALQLAPWDGAEVRGSWGIFDDDPTPQRVPLGRWLRGLRRWGHEAGVRAAAREAAKCDSAGRFAMCLCMAPREAPVREAVQAALIAWALA